MRNPLGKSRHFQPSNGLKSGVLGGGEGGVIEVELGFEGEDVRQSQRDHEPTLLVIDLTNEESSSDDEEL